MGTLKGSIHLCHRLCCSLFLSMCSCHFTYLRISSSSRPTVLTQYPFAQKCRPQYRRFSSKWWSNTLIALLPLMKPTVSAIENLGGTLSTRWIWSTWTLPSRISTLLHSHNCLMISRTLRPICPVRIRNRYFGHHTTWYLHSQTACANFLNRLIEYLLLIFRVPNPNLKEVFVFRKSLTHPHSIAGTISLADGLRG